MAHKEYAAALNGGALVSCIMPTHNRRAFVPQAITYFLRQDYSPRELLIIDDGTEAVADLIPPDPRIRYQRLDSRHPLGAKRNLACHEARGDVILHWDDDDWMASRRISYQVKALLDSGVDLCGADKLLFYDPQQERAWQYHYPVRHTPLLAGGSLCYLRRAWQGNPFPDIDIGEDCRFVWSSRPKKTLAHEESSFYVAVNHPGNTNARNTSGRRWRAFPVESVQALMAHDVDFYRELSQETSLHAAAKLGRRP